MSSKSSLTQGQARRWTIWAVVLVAGVTWLLVLRSCIQPDPVVPSTPTATQTAFVTQAPSNTPTVTNTPWPTEAPTETPTVRIVPTLDLWSTKTPTPTRTPWPTSTATVAPTDTPARPRELPRAGGEHP